MSEDELWLDRETMRTLGYAAVDRLVEHLADPSAHRLLRRASREEMEARLDGPPPEDGDPGFEELLDRLWTDVVPFASRVEHPGYFAFIPACHTWIGVLGDLIASGTNMYAGSWMEGAGPTQLELTVLDWFRTWVGLPESAAGILVSGGSAANMTALACARETLLGPMSARAVAYVGDQAHSSLARAARALGFRPDQVRVLPTDADLRLSPATLSAAIEADRNRGLQPLFVAAAGGATNTGVVDPLPSLADVCRDERVWLHVDAAYGGFAVLTERGRRELAGIDRADSVTLDPHKWLYQPFECGAVLVRDGSLLRKAFEIAPDYLHDTEVHGRDVNLADHGFQLTRMSRAVKVWLTVQYFGLGAIRRSIDRCIDLAEHAEERIRSDAKLELMHARALSIVCFRRTEPGWDERAALEANSGLVTSLAEGGEGLVSTTRLEGRLAVRLCVLNHTSGAVDVDRVLDHFARGDIEGSISPLPARHAVPDRWLRRERPAVAALRRAPLLGGLSADQLEQLSVSAHQERVPAGAPLVRRWEASRDFYVIVSGSAEVRADDRSLSRLEAGDFFGELAARDWGAGYAYPRLATVIALTDVDLLVVPSTTFNDLMRGSQAFASIIERAIAERLPTVRPAG